MRLNQWQSNLDQGTEEAHTAVDLKLFKGVPLTNNLRYTEVACLVNRSKEEWQNFPNNIKVLQPYNWPYESGVLYAEKEIEEFLFQTRGWQTNLNRDEGIHRLGQTQIWWESETISTRRAASSPSSSQHIGQLQR